MQIVIDVPDIFVEWAKDEMSVEIFDNRSMADAMCSAIANGTPLPKGHGDLIDRSKIAFDYWSVDGHTCVGKESIFSMPVIVPAEQMLNTPTEIQNEIRDVRMLELIKAQGVTENEKDYSWTW